MLVLHNYCCSLLPCGILCNLAFQAKVIEADQGKFHEPCQAAILASSDTAERMLQTDHSVSLVNALGMESCGHCSGTVCLDLEKI